MSTLCLLTYRQRKGEEGGHNNKMRREQPVSMSGQIYPQFSAALPKTYLAEALQTQERLANKRFRGKVETGGTGWLSILKTGLNLRQKQGYKQKAVAAEHLADTHR